MYTLWPTLPYLSALEVRVHRARHVLVLNCFIRSKRRGEWFKLLEDGFYIDEVISSLVCLRSGFRNTSFNVNNCWLRLPQLTNRSTIPWSFALFLTQCFLCYVLLLPIRPVDEVRDDESDNLLSLNTTN